MPTLGRGPLSFWTCAVVVPPCAAQPRFCQDLAPVIVDSEIIFAAIPALADPLRNSANNSLAAFVQRDRKPRCINFVPRLLVFGATIAAHPKPTCGEINHVTDALNRVMGAPTARWTDPSKTAREPKLLT